MDVKELRLNNWVLFTDENGNSHEKEISFVDLVVIGTDGNADSYSGIPLTAEWLEKFGFKYKYNAAHEGETKQFSKVLNNKALPFSIYHDCEGLWYYKISEVESVIINFVHELQNLYFALTKTELKLKEG